MPAYRWFKEMTIYERATFHAERVPGLVAEARREIEKWARDWHAFYPFPTWADVDLSQEFDWEAVFEVYVRDTLHCRSRYRDHVVQAEITLAGGRFPYPLSSYFYGSKPLPPDTPPELLLRTFEDVDAAQAYRRELEAQLTPERRRAIVKWWVALLRAGTVKFVV